MKTLRLAALALTALVLTSGCGDKKVGATAPAAPAPKKMPPAAPAATPPAAKAGQPAPTTAAASDVGKKPMTFAQALVQMEKGTTAICACKTKECMQAEEAKMRAVMKRSRPDMAAKPTPEQLARVRELAQKVQACTMAMAKTELKTAKTAKDPAPAPASKITIAEVLVQLKQTEKTVCACKDMACVEAEQKRVKTALSRGPGGSLPTAEEREQIQKVSLKIQTCTKALAGK